MLESKNSIFNYVKSTDYLNNLINELERKIVEVLDYFEIKEINEKIVINIIESKFDKLFFECFIFNSFIIY